VRSVVGLLGVRADPRGRKLRKIWCSLLRGAIGGKEIRPRGALPDGDYFTGGASEGSMKISGMPARPSVAGANAPPWGMLLMHIDGGWRGADTILWTKGIGPAGLGQMGSSLGRDNRIIKDIRQVGERPG